jgi:hypothetical protein
MGVLFGPVIGLVHPGMFAGMYGRSCVLPVKSTAKCRDLAHLTGA